MGMSNFWFLMGARSRGPRRTVSEERRAAIERRRHSEQLRKELFLENYSDRLDDLFEDYPKVLAWGGTSEKDITVSYGDKRPRLVHGHLVLDDMGEILFWESNDGIIKCKRKRPTLPLQKKIAQITAMLRDNEALSKYCELVADSLLEEGRCVFNAIYALNMKEDFFSEKYAGEWVDAWIGALLEEFQAKSAEPAGIGVFMLEAK